MPANPLKFWRMGYPLTIKQIRGISRVYKNNPSFYPHISSECERMIANGNRLRIGENSSVSQIWEAHGAG